MKITVVIEDDPKTGLVSLTITGEQNPDKRSKVANLFDLVEPVIRQHFQPVRTFFRPVRKTNRVPALSSLRSSAHARLAVEELARP